MKLIGKIILHTGKCNWSQRKNDLTQRKFNSLHFQIYSAQHSFEAAHYKFSSAKSNYNDWIKNANALNFVCNEHIFSADAFKTGYNAFWRKIDCSWSVMDIDFTPCLIV